MTPRTPSTEEPWGYWRKQLAARDVDPALLWPDVEVMVVVRGLVTAHDAAHVPLEAEIARLRAAAEAVFVSLEPHDPVDWLPSLRALHTALQEDQTP